MLMKVTQNTMEIKPEFLYSVGQAARYFGVHRCTIYDYLSNEKKPLPFLKSPTNGRCVFLGQTLIEYKQSGLPKTGRQRKSGKQ